MARRPYCDGSHEWERAPRHPFRQICRNCPATFPCREACAHVDCEEGRGETAKCAVCRKPVTFEQGFHFTRGDRLVRVHAEKCAEAYSKLS